MSLEVDLRTFLTGTASVLASSAVFCGRVRPAVGVIPAKSVWVSGAGGWAPQDVFSGISTTMFTRTASVIVRGTAQDYAGGLTLALDVHQRLHRGAVSGYLWVACMQSAPSYMGLDDQEQPSWNILVNACSKG